MKVKPIVRIFGAITVIGSLVAGVYYFLFVRSRKPQVEMYFDDGSMLAIPGDTDDALPFTAIATEMLAEKPLGD